MLTPFSQRAWRGPSLAMQILALLLGGLVVAQVVTLILTMLLPPEQTAAYNLADIAAALRTPTRSGHGLNGRVQALPPETSGRGWLESTSTRDDLAKLLHAQPADVRLSFYTPLPFAGTAAAPYPSGEVEEPASTVRQPISDTTSDPEARSSVDNPAWHATPPVDAIERVGTVSGARLYPASYLIFVQARGGGRLPGGPALNPSTGGLPGGQPAFPPFGSYPGRAQTMPGGVPDITQRGGSSPAPIPAWAQTPPASELQARSSGDARSPQTSAPFSASSASGAQSSGSERSSRQAGPPAPSGSTSSPSPTRQRPGVAVGPPPPAFIFPGLGTVPTMSFGDASPPPPTNEAVAPRETPKPLPVPAERAQPRMPIAREAAPAPVPTESPPTVDQKAAAIPRPTPMGTARASPSPQPLPATGYQGAIERARQLFGLGPTPIVEGDFVAALRLPDGRWATVQPAPMLFTSWQERLLLWFALAFALVAPLGWLFARRLSQPLSRFADAAAQLGRDPSAAITALDGPAEIGRAAHAFNLMQNRLRAFVDDRTAMVGAISHDLRTPLTRMRFRIEDAPDDVREGMLQEVDEMEQMISSVLTFIRDASTPGVRERLDLRTLLVDVAEDAALIGGKVEVEAEVGATVEVDVLGMRRVLANLVENAIKYGHRATVRLSVAGDEAIAAVIDDGPGLPDAELEQVFQPFYRTAAARASEAPGSGLGLAVCRSIARAHGGDVRLMQTNDGFTAEVRVPLSYEPERLLAA